MRGHDIKVTAGVWRDTRGGVYASASSCNSGEKSISGELDRVRYKTGWLSQFFSPRLAENSSTWNSVLLQFRAFSLMSLSRKRFRVFARGREDRNLSYGTAFRREIRRVRHFGIGRVSADMCSRKERNPHSLFRNDDAVYVETSVLADVCVPHKAHLLPAQVGNACVKEGNTHVNGKGYNTSVRSEPCKLRNSQSISNFIFLADITVNE
jgi:hypothetical protein